MLCSYGRWGKGPSVLGVFPGPRGEGRAGDTCVGPDDDGTGPSTRGSAALSLHPVCRTHRIGHRPRFERPQAPRAWAAPGMGDEAARLGSGCCRCRGGLQCHAPVPVSSAESVLCGRPTPATTAVPRCHVPASAPSPLTGHTSPLVHGSVKEGLVSPAEGQRGGALRSGSSHEPLENT